MKIMAIVLSLASLSMGCTSLGWRHSAAEYANEFVNKQGIKAAAPVLLDGNHRLMIFLEREEPKPEKVPKEEILLDAETGEKVPTPRKRELEKANKVITVAIAENEENKGVLVKLHKLLMENEGTTIYLHGKEIGAGQRWNEYADGLDFYVVACGVYVPSAHKYFIIQTTYGDHWMDSISWTAFVKTVFKQGVDIIK
jgi:hypothetical protein